MIVIGIDGMDHGLTAQMLAAGELPNLARLAEEGTFQRLETSIPPLSPVAWSDFITGMDPGGHGIFDFLHRDPDRMLPFFAMTRAESAEGCIGVGRYQFPRGGSVELLRRGTPFWKVLEDHGVRTRILRMPVNYPPSGEATEELSGMGTPDVRGTYGIFQFFTSEIFFQDRDVSGGEIHPLDLWENVARGTLYGPPDVCDPQGRDTELEFVLDIDSEAEAALLEIGGERRLMKVGEWSDWVPVEFELNPLLAVHGIARFYLRQIEPEVELYVSPVNWNPLEPDQPMSTPPSFATELAEATGLYYTQGMPEDTQALRQEVLTREEFLQQAAIANEELLRQYRYFVDRFDDGLLFYYFGNADQVSHMMWRTLDPDHPAYDPVADAPFAHVIPDLYKTFDGAVGYALEHMPPDTTLVVMSDHGFASWRRTFHLNRWLYENGYLALENPNLAKDPGLFLNVDWSHTRAYGLGLNGLYVNLEGRERSGIVPASQREALLEELASRLQGVVDPATGQPAITRTYILDRVFQHHEALDVGPDMVIGYAKGTRGADDSALGEMAPQVFFDNLEEWSGDHGMDHTTVPGVLFSNRPLRKPVSSLRDLAAALLAEFGVDRFPPTD